LRDNKNAALCSPTDVDAWHSALARAMKDNAWRARLARQARQDVEQYTWRKRVHIVLAWASTSHDHEDRAWIPGAGC